MVFEALDRNRSSELRGSHLNGRRNLLTSSQEERKKKANMWICSPILAPSHADLAPCSIHCAELDVLRDEAIAYNDLLNKSGTPSRIKVYKGVCHPWAHWDGELEKAKEYVRDTCADLRRAPSVTGSG